WHRDSSGMGMVGHLPAPSAPSGPTTPQSLKLTYPETLDRIKEEFQFLQNQYHSLKLECEKLATEKTEIQRHYVMLGYGAAPCDPPYPHNGYFDPK
uniref:Groucho/TLE N-terminal Q-rich domain-containing protein n=1 Tax=Meleagris gallopavo TaxID=9103 RepID=A0A803YB20_MELGA